MVFSQRKLQEIPLYFAFIDLTKAFDLVSRDDLFKILILLKIGYPPKLQSMIESFYTDMKGTVQLNDPLRIYSGVKQGSVLAPTLFWIFFAVLLMHVFSTANERTYMPTRSDGRLFNLARLRAKTKDREALIRDMLFADDAAVASLMGHFSKVCKGFGITISLKKANVLGKKRLLT